MIAAFNMLSSNEHNLSFRRIREVVLSQDVYIFEVTEKNFPEVVLQNSHQIPVVTEFLGVWSEYCFSVDAIFSALAKEFAGQFIFAKVDIDEQPELRKQYNIENVPTVIVFKNGEVARMDLGEFVEEGARALLREFGIFHESDELREQARAKHLAGDTQGAILLLTEAIKKHPSNTRVAMDMVQIFIDIGEIDSASALFEKLPEKDKDGDTGKSLSGQLNVIKHAAKTDGIDVLEKRVSENQDDIQAKFDLAVCYVAEHQYLEAMELLLVIVEKAPDFRDGAARELMILLIRTLTPAQPELASEYQRKLSNILAK